LGDDAFVKNQSDPPLSARTHAIGRLRNTPSSRVVSMAIPISSTSRHSLCAFSSFLPAGCGFDGMA
jgi:hypothetical protein